MRTIDEIYNSLLERKAIYPDLDALDSPSKASIWSNMLYVFAFSIWTHEQIFGEHKQEISQLINAEKSHTPRWYRTMALAFQYGFPLLIDSDQFNNTGHTETQVLSSKIIKYCAVTEAVNESRLIIKIATESGGILQPITEDQKTAFEYYISEIRDAGVQTTVINYLPDKLQVFLKIKRDPNVIDSNGVSIINGNMPVNDALKQFMRELPFNGELILNKMVDKLQVLEGVINPHLITVKTAWIDPEVGSYGNFESIEISKIPMSGYFTIDFEKSVIEYVV
ncbi:nucleotidyltransferase [Chryseobacterium indologenes]|uniref:Nucleotidyltransferase n=1 Tax=Chryseobacterium indologenes TaxID=253 RepID=A0AAD0YRK1_CHRID|nr:nucleotidyltransferase [Chryseobacterium indologenes]AZB17569.1 nucleotidyltransferase [Chryseobacterium indologenes]